ncbi:MAG: pyridoxal phosphate-dependent aminotransferase, partial [Pygmaiobacter sp.]
MEHRHIAKRFWKSEATAMQAAADQMSAYDDIINLSIGDTDFITDERITRGAMEDALAGHTKYTNPQGDPELIAEIRRYYDEEYGMALANDQVFV